MRNINFNSKEEYLSYKTQWKKDYNLLSSLIRTKNLRDKEYQKIIIKVKNKFPWSDKLLFNLTELHKWVKDRRELLIQLISQNEKMTDLDSKYMSLCILKRDSPLKIITRSKYYKAVATSMLCELKEAKKRAQHQFENKILN